MSQSLRARVLSFGRAFGRTLARLVPLVLLALALVLLADQAVAFAQSTGGSFGGGSFGGGGSSSSGGGSSSSNDDGEGIFWIVAWIVTSRLPWPIKIGLVGLIVGGYAVFKFVQKKQKEKNDQPPPPNAP